MADPSKASHGAVETDSEIPPQKMAAICAAMMEELGNARKDTLPLEDRNNSGGQIDLQALDQSKKANDKRTREFKITQKNAAAHDAWKKLQLESQSTDLDLDDMNSGQSHRAGVSARLGAAGSSSRGRGNTSNARRCDISGRGGHLALKGGIHHNTGRNPAANHGPSQVFGGSMNLEARGQPTPRGKILSGRRGTTRGGHPASPRKMNVTGAPRPALSFDDSRSVNVLPISRGVASTDISGSGTAGSLRHKARSPVKSVPLFRLATPEQFLDHSWTTKSSGISSSVDITTKLNSEVTALHTVKEQAAAQPLLGLRDEERSLDFIDSASSGPVIQASETSSVGVPSGTTSVAIRGIDAKARVSRGLAITDVGFGEVFIVTNMSCGESQYVLQFKAQGKLHLEHVLGSSFDYAIDGSTLSFDSSFMGNSCRWMVEPRHHWMLISLKNAIKKYKDQSTSPIVSAPIIGTELSSAESTTKVEALISFSDDEMPGPIVSSWAQDLLCLMDGKTPESAEAPEPPEENTPATIDVTKPGITKRAGLASSMYATAEIMDKYLTENPPKLGNPAADRHFREEFKRRVRASSKYSSSSKNMDPAGQLTCIKGEDSFQKHVPQEQSYTLEQPLIQHQNPAQQKHHPNNASRVQYTIEDMKKYRPNACLLTKPLMEEWIESSQRGRLNIARSASVSGVASAKLKNVDVPQVPVQDVINITRQGISIVAGVEKPNNFEVLASPRYSITSQPKTGLSSPFSSKSQSAFAELAGISNSDTQSGMKNTTDGKISNIIKLPTFAPTLQSAEDRIRTTNEPESMSATNSDVLQMTSLMAAQNANRNEDWTSEAQTQQSHYLHHDNLNNLRKRDSFTSLASKDSDVTLKASKIKPEYGFLSQPEHAIHHSHTKHLSINSSTSSASFATASEGEICLEDKPIKLNSTKLQGLSLSWSMTDVESSLIPLLEFPSDHMAELGKARPTAPMEAPYAENMFESNKSSTPFNAKQALSGQETTGTLPSFKKPTASRDMSLLKTRGGLASSIFASSASTSPALSNIENKTRTRPVNPNVSAMNKVAFGGCSSYSHSPSATGFDPLTNRNRFPGSPMTLPGGMIPLVATVLINDPMRPGGILEVTGRLKVGDDPFIAHRPVPTSQLPLYGGLISENHGPGYVSNGPFSNPSPVTTLARTPLSPNRAKNTDSISDVQQEVQSRLQRSLAARSSASPP